MDNVTHRLDLKPTSTKRKEQCKSSSIVAGIAKTEWIYEIFEDNCDDISIPSKKAFDLLQNKSNTINELRIQFNLRVTFNVTIYLKTGTRPLGIISKEFISFAASIGAEMGFDLYCYDNDNHCQLKPLEEININVL